MVLRSHDMPKMRNALAPLRDQAPPAPVLAKRPAPALRTPSARVSSWTSFGWSASQWMMLFFVRSGPSEFHAAVGVIPSDRGLNRRLPRPPRGPSNTTAICGDEVTVQASEEEIRFLLVSGQPLREPIAWYGPIVMNKQAELAAGCSRASGWDLHQERLSRHCDVAIASYRSLPCARGPKKRRNRCGTASILFVALSPIRC